MVLLYPGFWSYDTTTNASCSSVERMGSNRNTQTFHKGGAHESLLFGIAMSEHRYENASDSILNFFFAQNRIEVYNTRAAHTAAETALLPIA